MPHALLVDDNASTITALSAIVADEGFSVATAETIERAQSELSKQPPDVILADLNLPDGSGMALLDQLAGVAGPAVVLITGHASLDTAIEALRRGVTDYLVKPVDIQRLREILGDIRKTSGLASEIRELRSSQRATGRFGSIIGASEGIQRASELIARIAPSSASVLISGESGTGKDVVAKTIHDLSRRRLGPYIPVNCSAISPTLIESELFGHERGSFTGADKRHRGYFERASRGTLFLDEITEMPLELQARLLRVLETGSFVRVGGEEPLSVDVRIIAASNRSVLDAIEKGKLREDLYYRLKVFHLSLPALRDRLDDVPLLAQWFLDEFAKVEGRRKTFTADAIDMLRGYSWPGNVRELRNVVHSAYILSADTIDSEALPAEIRFPKAAASAPPPSASATPAQSAPELQRDVISIKVGTSIADAERQLIMATLEHCAGNKSRAADMLGVSLKTLYNRLSSYRIGESSADADAAVAPVAE
jgi:two-component system response regulator AtoC